MYEKYGLLINGEWRGASDGATRSVTSPVTELEIGTVPAATKDDVAEILASAEKAQNIWAQTPAWERAKILRKTAELMRERVLEFAQIMSTETGKPLAEAMGETGGASDQFEWYGEEAKRIYGQTIPPRAMDEKLTVQYQPVGVSLSLSAWNFPALLPARKIAAALAAGCAMIARPASEAPGSAFLIAECLIEAGLPKGVLSIITGAAEPMVGDLIASDIIKKVSLTGSVPVGKTILKQAADSIKKVSMELGGHAPVIVHKDVDPIWAAQKLAATKYRNCGQVCISPTRFYVHEDIYDQFTEEFAKFAKSVELGDGLKDGVTMGPMIRERALNTTLELIEDAKAKGAEILAGGKRAAQFNKGHFLEPTVMKNVTADARIMSEEPFAPVAPITSFSDVDEVIKLANGTEFGLAAYVFSHDSAMAEMTAARLDAGMVGINETLLATAEAPFGGIKQSGYGREGGSLGIMDYLVPKYIRHKLIAKEL